jgi:hypothetical protein
MLPARPPKLLVSRVAMLCTGWPGVWFQIRVEIFLFSINIRGHAVAQWLRHCATNQKVVELILDGVTGIFH